MTPPTSRSSFVAAVLATSSDVPESFSRFEALISHGSLEPDFTEHSIRFGAALDPYRVTHYFDVSRDDGPRVRAVGERFLLLAKAAGHLLSDTLRDLVLTWLPTRTELAQIVLGIDARADAFATRTKLYVVLREPAPDLVTRISRDAGTAIPPGLDPAEAYLVGLDLGPSGVSGVKLYLRLDPNRIHRVVRNIGEVRPLVAGARSIVLSQRLGADGARQLHFHATDDRRYLDWLTKRATDSISVATAVSHIRAVDAQVRGSRVGPWIIGLPLRDGVLDVTTGNIYLHITDATKHEIR